MNKNSNSIELCIHDSNKEVYKGLVASVSSVNTTGPFDILANHSNFISIISKYITFVEINKKKFTVNIEKAVLKCESNKVDIYIGIEQLL